MMKVCNLRLDLGLSGDLNFQEAKKICEEAKKEHFKISFKLDFGLFSNLKKPLSNQSQYLSFELSLKHFKKTLWDPYQHQIKEVIFYKGSLDFTEDFCFDENQIHNFQGWIEDQFLDIEACCKEADIVKRLHIFFCQAVKMDYLQMLRSTLPEIVPVCIQLDAKKITDPLLYILLTNKEIYHPFNLIVTNKWMKEVKSSPFAICLPDTEYIKGQDYTALKNAFDFFQERKIPCRFIPESTLITNWDGVDYLIVAKKTVQPLGMRKLQGFVAAEGTVVSLQDPMGFANELSFDEFENEFNLK